MNSIDMLDCARGFHNNEGDDVCSRCGLNLQETQTPETPDYVRKILDISTAHVSEETAGKLGDALQQWLETAPFIAYTKSRHNDEYGWWVYVPSEPGREMEPGFPADLKTCMEHARSLGCDWIMFDRDGVTIDALPDYDW